MINVWSVEIEFEDRSQFNGNVIYWYIAWDDHLRTARNRKGIHGRRIIDGHARLLDFQTGLIFLNTVSWDCFFFLRRLDFTSCLVRDLHLSSCKLSFRLLEHACALNRVSCDRSEKIQMLSFTSMRDVDNFWEVCYWTAVCFSLRWWQRVWIRCPARWRECFAVVHGFGVTQMLDLILQVVLRGYLMSIFRFILQVTSLIRVTWVAYRCQNPISVFLAGRSVCCWIIRVANASSHLPVRVWRCR